MMLKSFMDKYRDAYSPEAQKDFYETVDARARLTIIDNYAKEHDIKLYLILDEYDNFTNNVLNEKGEAVYTALTHASGFYRDIFKIFKIMFTQIFMTGVSPVTLDDLTSGFNIAYNISPDEGFNQVLGFSTEDIREMLKYYVSNRILPEGTNVEAAIEVMRPWYDNYCFAERAIESQSRVFNSDMVLYYLNRWISEQQPPLDMVDPNTKTDYGKMKKLLQLDKLDGNRKGIVHKIAEQGEIAARVETSFPARMLVKPKMFTSLIFYYGMLTYNRMRGSQTILSIPNNNVRKQYYEYLLEQFEEVATVDTDDLDSHFYELAYEGNWQPAFQYLADAYAKVSSVRDGIEGERNLQGFFMAYLSLNTYYITAPEIGRASCRERV